MAIKVCKKVGIDTLNCISGKDIDKYTDEELKEKVRKCHLYSKLSPIQKQRVVRILQENGNTVGYMGDGINDSPPLKQADVGISVDRAVDIAKETNLDVTDVSKGISRLKELNVIERVRDIPEYKNDDSINKKLYTVNHNLVFKGNIKNLKRDFDNQL